LESTKAVAIEFPNKDKLVDNNDDEVTPKDDNEVFDNTSIFPLGGDNQSIEKAALGIVKKGDPLNSKIHSYSFLALS
jgi:hypothetical protein